MWRDAASSCLDEHRVVAEGLPGLGLGRTERPVEILGHVDPPDAAPAPTRRRLDHHGVAEPGGLAVGGLDRAHRSTAPRCDGDADGVGDALGGDLVPGAAHGFGCRADEADAEALAKLRERGLLGDETPAHPGGVSLGAQQRLLQPVEVEVRALDLSVARVDERRRPQPVPFVGFPHEHGLLIRVGVQRDRPQVRR